MIKYLQKKTKNFAECVLCRIEYKLYAEEVSIEDLFLYGWNDLPYRKRRCVIRRAVFGELEDFCHIRKPSIAMEKMEGNFVARYSSKINDITVNTFLLCDGRRVYGNYRKECIYSEILIYESVLHECVHARQSLEKRSPDRYVEGNSSYRDGYLEYKMQPSEYEAHTESEKKVMSVIERVRADGKTSEKIEAYLEYHRKIQEADEHWLETLYPGYTFEQLSKEIGAYLSGVPGAYGPRVEERMRGLQNKERGCVCKRAKSLYH